ncbi:MAG: hypothetical protein DBY45_06840 [Clostridiales bacterium]|nr:MAG: hypothetical protein DBY45_07400 [Clostridiales bacterium]PWL43742.1 MAG: hypothetical protein DBY45_06840 [Clostridiales bacterium]
MKESIYTIPVSEVFEPRSDCPLCRLRDTLEQRCIDYIMGAAMMEPDIRIKTNEQGFCVDHYEMMLKLKNRLSLALMLESHLTELKKGKYGDIRKKAKTKKAKRDGVKTVNDTCYVCNTIQWAMGNMVTTILRQYQADADFKKLFSEQEYLCLPHLETILCAAEEEMPKKALPEFTEAAIELADKHLQAVLGDVSHFCKMFDYRNSGKDADWGNSRDSIERAVALLSARDFRTDP